MKKLKLSKIVKKVMAICVVFTLCLCLAACGEADKYEKANNLLTSGEYSAALKIYEKLGDYENSKENADKCKKEIGMRENSDYEFLQKMEESIKERMETTSNENFDRSSVVNTELAHLEQFKDKTFYDPELKKLADKYIEGLNIQKEALKKEFEYEYQIEWQRGIVCRFDVLKSLYENYGFMKDDAKFIGTYVSKCDDERKLLEAYEAIEKDLDTQIQATKNQWYFDGIELSLTFKNNTKYEYSTCFEFAFFDSKGTKIGSNVDIIENIKPGSSYVVSVYVPNASRLDHHTFNNFYRDVKY